MKKVDNLIFKADMIAHPPLTKLQQYIAGNEYIGRPRDELIDMMCEEMSVEQNRKIMCALAWGGGSGG